MTIMMRALPIVLLLLLPSAASADCRWQFDRADAEFVSRAVWRNIKLGSDAYLKPSMRVMLCRPNSAAPGHGLETIADAWLPVTGDGVGKASATVRYLYLFGEGNRSWFGVGYTQHYWSTGDQWSGELGVDIKHQVILEDYGLTFWPYVEAGYDMGRYEAWFTRGGVEHIVGMGDSALTLDVSVSLSNYDDSFGYHGAEVRGWFDRSRLIKNRVGVGAGAGHSWAAAKVGPNAWWVGLRIRFE